MGRADVACTLHRSSGESSTQRPSASVRTSVAVARSVARTLERRGARPDRAMAEAILVAEIGAVSDAWTGVVRRFRVG